MRLLTYAEFEGFALAHGADEVLVRNWEPGLAIEEHTHPFEAQALLVAGQMWLTCQGQTRHLFPGDEFHLHAGTPHSERYGPEGATYWVARRAKAAT